MVNYVESHMFRAESGETAQIFTNIKAEDIRPIVEPLLGAINFPIPVGSNNVPFADAGLYVNVEKIPQSSALPLHLEAYRRAKRGSDVYNLNFIVSMPNKGEVLVAVFSPFPLDLDMLAEFLERLTVFTTDPDIGCGIERSGSKKCTFRTLSMHDIPHNSVWAPETHTAGSNELEKLAPQAIKVEYTLANHVNKQSSNVEPPERKENVILEPNCLYYGPDDAVYLSVATLDYLNEHKIPIDSFFTKHYPDDYPRNMYVTSSGMLMLQVVPSGIARNALPICKEPMDKVVVVNGEFYVYHSDLNRA